MKNSSARVKNSLSFLIQLFLMLLVGFFIHDYILKNNNLYLEENMLLFTYAVNYLLTITIFIVLLFLKKKYLEQFGYLFMFGSFFKFLIFFLVFYPVFKESNGVSKVEFLAFFIPYAIALIVETTSLIKILSSTKST